MMIKKFDDDYYNTLVKNLANDNIEYEWLNSYIKNKNNIPEPSLNKDIKEPTEMSDIFSDESLYKKPWAKLNTIHKIIKVKEYINNLKIENEDKKNKLKEEIIDLIKMKLVKKEDINYDIDKAIIINISKLEIKNGNYKYNS